MGPADGRFTFATSSFFQNKAKRRRSQLLFSPCIRLLLLRRYELITSFDQALDLFPVEAISETPGDRSMLPNLCGLCTSAASRKLRKNWRMRSPAGRSLDIDDPFGRIREVYPAKEFFLLWPQNQHSPPAHRWSTPSSDLALCSSAPKIQFVSSLTSTGRRNSSCRSSSRTLRSQTVNRPPRKSVLPGRRLRRHRTFHSATSVLIGQGRRKSGPFCYNQGFPHEVRGRSVSRLEL